MDLDVAAATSAAQAGAIVRPLAGRSAVVTGSTSGIGLGIARALAAAGADVMLNGFGDPVAIDRLCRELEARCGVTVAHSAADMQRPEQIQAMLGEAGERLGGVDILVCNAGIQHVAPLEEFPPAKWDAILAINLTAAFHAMRLVIPAMRAQGWGRIVNIASAHGLVASPFKGAYVAAKHGILGLTRTVALEVAQAGITCNAICPGYVKTHLVDAQIADQAKARNMSPEQVMRDVILAAQPTKKFVEFDQLAGLMLYLCSDAGASVNGVPLSIDGGWTAA